MRRFIFVLLLFLGFSNSFAQKPENSPNIIIIFLDDLGYGDLGSYGNPTIHTPNIDKMAQEGMKFTQFYAAASVCTPSRAAILTGRYPIRTGLVRGMIPGRVLFPNDKKGLEHEEVTIAELLKQKDYATKAIGKWHLGDLPKYLPMQQGFDSYYGIPYSNDMDHVPAKNGHAAYKNVPLMRNEKIVERPAVQNTLTKRYTKEAIDFIKDNSKKPFFLYLAHTMPHVPLHASDDFKDTSKRGLYGDVVEEIDWSVEQILSTLKAQGIDKKTLVILTSDNGPWLVQKENGGSAGLLKGGKGTTWEGGMRVPMIARWPGKIPPNTTSVRLSSTMDLLPTIAEITDLPLPDRKIDGKSIFSTLKGAKEENKNDFFAYFRDDRLYAARLGPWKAHFLTQNAYPDGPLKTENPPLLYNVEIDPSERFDLAKEHQDIIQEIRRRSDELLTTITTTRKPNIEAEDLIEQSSVTGGNLRIQDMSEFNGEWSQKSQLWWVNALPGNKLIIPIEVDEKGLYDLYGFFTRAGDYGIIRLFVNGKQVGNLMDGYSPGIEWTGPVSYGEVSFDKGQNKISVEIVGKDERSSGFSDGYLVGIDGFLIKKK